MRADGSIVIEADLTVGKAEKKLEKLKGSIEKTEDEIAKTQEARDKASKEGAFKAGELDAEKRKLVEMRNILQEMKDISKDKGFSDSARKEAKAAIPGQQADIADQAARVRLLQAEYNKVENAVERYDRKLADASEKLSVQKTQAGALITKINSVSAGTKAMAAAQTYAGESMRRFGLRLKEVVRSALIFTVISQSVAKLREWTGKVIKTNDEAQKSFAQLKGALLTMAQPLVEVLIPALITFANVMTRVTLAVAQLMSMLFGKTISQSQEAAKSLNEETKALEGVEGASEDAGKSMASFDEINKLSSGAAGGGAAESETPSFDFDLESQEGKLNGILGLITTIGAALLAWKLGGSLLGSLKIFAGLMVAIGGGILIAKNLWDAWQNGLNMDNLIGILTGALLLVSGLAIAFGTIGAAIGLVVSGVLMLATAFHDAMENGWNFQNTLLAIAGIVATGLGISMLTGSVIPLLIASIAAFLLALTVAYGDGEALIDGFKDIFGGLRDFVVGIFTGDLTLAFEGLGRVFEGLGKVFDTVIDAIKNAFFSFLDWLDEKTGGRFHGIIETIKSFISSVADLTKGIFSEVMDAIQRTLEGIIEFIVGVFTADWERAFNGLSDVVHAFYDMIVGIFGRIAEFISEKVGAVIDWAKNALKNIGPDLSKTTYTSRSVSTFSLANVPALANGAVIPPNREFLAVLGDQRSGTNIEAPLSTIEQAVENVLSRRGMGGGNITVTVKPTAGLTRYLKYELDAETTRQGERLVNLTR